MSDSLCRPLDTVTVRSLRHVSEEAVDTPRPIWMSVRRPPNTACARLGCLPRRIRYRYCLTGVTARRLSNTDSFRLTVDQPDGYHTATAQVGIIAIRPPDTDSSLLGCQPGGHEIHPVPG
jgi:hypothetical protein